MPRNRCALTFKSRLLAQHIDAERNIRARLLTCDIAQTRRQTIKCTGEPIHAWRSLHPLLRADGRQKLFKARHRDAQLTF